MSQNDIGLQRVKRKLQTEAEDDVVIPKKGKWKGWPFCREVVPATNILNEDQSNVFDELILTKLGTTMLYDPKTKTSHYVQGIKYKNEETLREKKTAEHYGITFCNILRDELFKIIHHGGCMIDLITIALVYRLTFMPLLKDEYNLHLENYKRKRHRVRDFERFFRHPLNVLQSTYWVYVMLHSFSESSAELDTSKLCNVVQQYMSVCIKLYYQCTKMMVRQTGEKRSKHKRKMVKLEEIPITGAFVIMGTTVRFDRTNFEASAEELQEFQIYIDAQVDFTMNGETPRNSASGLQVPMNRIQEYPVLECRVPEHSDNENAVLECTAPEDTITKSPVLENIILEHSVRQVNSENHQDRIQKADVSFSIQSTQESLTHLERFNYAENQIQECAVPESRFPDSLGNGNAVSKWKAPDEIFSHNRYMDTGTITEDQRLVSSTISVDASNKSTQTSEQSLSAYCSQVSASFQRSNESNDPEVTDIEESLLSQVKPQDWYQKAFGSAKKCPDYGSLVHTVNLDTFLGSFVKHNDPHESSCTLKESNQSTLKQRQDTTCSTVEEILSNSSNQKKIKEVEPTGKGVINFTIILDDIRDILDPTCKLNVGVAAAIWRKIFEAFPSHTIQFTNPLYCYTDIVDTDRKTGGSEGDGYDLKCNREVVTDMCSGETVLVDTTGGHRIVIHQDRITIHALFYKGHALLVQINRQAEEILVFDSQIISFYNVGEPGINGWCLQEFVHILQEKIVPKFNVVDTPVKWDVKFWGSFPQQKQKDIYSCSHMTMYAAEMILSSGGSPNFPSAVSIHELRVCHAILLLKCMPNGNLVLSDFVRMQSLCNIEAQLTKYTALNIGNVILADETSNLERCLLLDLITSHLENKPLPDIWLDKLNEYNLQLATIKSPKSDEEKKERFEVLNKRLLRIVNGYKMQMKGKTKEVSCIIQCKLIDQSQHNIDAAVRKFQKQMEETTCYSANRVLANMRQEHGIDFEDLPPIQSLTEDTQD